MPAIQASLDAISEAIVHAVSTVEGVGATVHRGRYGVKPPSIPWASVSAPGMTSDQGPVMGWYTRHLAYDVQVWAAASKSDLDVRVAEAEALLDRLVTALDEERARTSSVLSVLPTWEVASGVLDALADPIPGNALVVLLTIECSYQRPVGVSGVDR